MRYAWFRVVVEVPVVLAVEVMVRTTDAETAKHVARRTTYREIEAAEDIELPDSIGRLLEPDIQLPTGGFPVHVRRVKEDATYRPGMGGGEDSDSG